VLLCIHKRRLVFRTAELELPKKEKLRTVWWNTGMILLLLSCAVMVVLNVI